MNQKHYLDKFTQYNGYSVPLGMPSNVRMCSTMRDSFSTVGDIMKNVGELNIPHSMMISSYMYHDIPHSAEHPHGTQDNPYSTEHPLWYSRCHHTVFKFTLHGIQDSPSRS